MSIYIYYVFFWSALTSLVVSQGSGNGETNAGTSIYYDEDIASTTEPTQTPKDDEVTTEPILVPQSPSKPELRNNFKHTSETGNSCPKIETVTNSPNSLIKCQCQDYEVLVDGNCTTYEGDVVVDAEEGFIFTRPYLDFIPHQTVYLFDCMSIADVTYSWKTVAWRNVSTYTITIRDLICDTEMSEEKNFTKGMFRVRDRGDIILLKPAGDLDGLRVGNYCINHHLKDSGELTWTLKACIPVPNVPKCCPPGSAMKDGSCQSAETPATFQPPVFAKPFVNSIKLPTISHFVSNLTCSKYRLQTKLLSFKQSHLVSFPSGVHLGWIPDENTGRRGYKRCSDYCVDGIGLDGSVDYYVSYCYTDPYDYHKEICGDGPCLRKCCKKGEIMDANGYACVTYENAIFSPPTPRESSNYSIVEGWPICTVATKITGNFTIDEDGNFHNANITLDPIEYCVDMVISDDGMVQSGLVCLATISVWSKVHPIIFSICNVISLIFLVLCHLVSPSLLKNGGAHQLCHAVALFFAYGTNFILSDFNYLFADDGCIIIGKVR
ncbi:hypothetical protein SK128_019348 [Halocaridina rubra]|uniref:Uncharacterized protein n=1 Tax=Halocaridina rubra TaxID=373956 RepID=A0AAN8X139_HALRR